MAAPIRFLSGRNQQQKIGIEGSTENQKVLEVVGRVGIGTTIFEPTSELEVRGGAIISGILTASNIEVSAGQVNFSQLNVTGVSTFGNTIDSNGRIVGAATSNVIPFLYSNFTDLPSAATYHGAFAHVHSTGKAYYAHAGNWVELVNKEVNGTVGTGTERYNIGPVDLTTLDVSGISTFAGAADFNGNVDIDGHTELDDVNVSGAITATTFTGNLAGTVNTAAQPNITSLGTLSALTVSGDITANGNIAGDGSTNITGIAGVTATTLSGTLQTAAQTNITSVGTLTGLDVNGHTELDNVNVSGIITTASLNATGKLTTTGIGISIANGAGNTAYIEGPSEIWIDPHPFGVGQTSGSVRIRGDLHVDGTEFIVNVDKIELGDFNIGIASTVSTNSLLDGAGLGIGATSIRKFITWNNATSALMSSENWNLASGKHYEINGTDVLTSDTLGSGVVNSSLTSVGTLSALTVSGDITANGNIAGDGSTNITGIAGVTATTLTGTLQTAAQTNVTSVGTLSALTVSGDITANGNIAGDGSTNITGIAGVTATTFTGNLAGTVNTAAQPNITSVGTLSALTVSGDITANGNITGDNATNISGINSVTATSFVGNGAGLTGITAGQVGALADIVEDTTPQLGGDLDVNGNNITGTGNVNLSGVITATSFIGNLVGTVNTAAQPNITSLGTLSALTVSGDITANGNIVGDSATNISGINSVTATSLHGNGTNITDILVSNVIGAVEGISIENQGSPVGTANSVGNINFVSSNLTATASGVGATITFTDTPTFDTVTVTNNITANGNIAGDNSTNITGINQVTATTFSGALSGNATSSTTATTATNVTVADESSDTTCFPLFATAATGDLAPKSGTNLTFNSADGTLTATDFNTTSDENLKDNIRTIENPLAKVVQIRGVNFDWKETQKPSVGVIAQEVEKVFPELVANGEKKTVNYNGLIGLLIEVVKEQQTQINSLNERLSQLE